MTGSKVLILDHLKFDDTPVGRSLGNTVFPGVSGSYVVFQNIKYFTSNVITVFFLLALFQLFNF